MLILKNQSKNLDVIKLNFFAPSLHGCKKINEKTLVPETWYNRLA